MGRDFRATSCTSYYHGPLLLEIKEQYNFLLVIKLKNTLMALLDLMPYHGSQIPLVHSAIVSFPPKLNTSHIYHTNMTVKYMYYKIVKQLLLHNWDYLRSSTFLIALIFSCVLFIAIKHLVTIIAFNLVVLAFELVTFQFCLCGSRCSN